MTQASAEQESPAKKGRPLKFDDVAVLAARIDAYFKDCDREEDSRVFDHQGELIQAIPELDKDGNRIDKKRLVCSACLRSLSAPGCKLLSGELKLRKPYTVTGLAVWLDTSRQTLLEYQGEVSGRERDPEFADTIKKAKQRIENYAEEKLYDKDYPTKGVIFSLSNNHDRWAEKVETTVKDERDAAADLAAAMMARAKAKATPPADAQPA